MKFRSGITYILVSVKTLSDFFMLLNRSCTPINKPKSTSDKGITKGKLIKEESTEKGSVSLITLFYFNAFCFDLVT